MQGGVSVFGYIKPDIGELKVKDYELYKATYCGLCRTMGKCTGCVSKMTLSYDFVFFALVRMALLKSKGEVKMRRCALHPLKKRPMLEMNPTLEYTAKASVLLTRIKLKDNVNDTHGFSHFLAKIATLVSVFFKKTDPTLEPLAEKIRACFDELLALEREECDSIDMVADTSGKLIGHVASFGLDEENMEIAYDIGYHLGKWVYVIDACDDLKKDVKKGAYNPLKFAFGNELTESNLQLLKSALMLELADMKRSLDKIDFSSHRDVQAILENVAWQGLVQETDRVLGKWREVQIESGDGEKGEASTQIEGGDSQLGGSSILNEESGAQINGEST